MNTEKAGQVKDGAKRNTLKKPHCDKAGTQAGEQADVQADVQAGYPFICFTPES